MLTNHARVATLLLRMRPRPSEGASDLVLRQPLG